MRSLKPAFIADLKTGMLQSVLNEVRGDESLDFQIRHNQVHIYYRGGKILDLRPKRGGGYHSSFDMKYMNNWTQRPEDIAQPILKPECSARIDSLEDAETWVLALPQLKRIMDRWFLDHPKKEREHQQMVVDQNNTLKDSGRSDFWILDIEYAKSIAVPDNPGHRKTARFDLIAMITSDGSAPRLAFIEMKYKDKALRPPTGIRCHLKDFRSFLADPENYESVKDEMFGVLRQKNDLGVLRGGHGLNVSEVVSSFSEDRPLFVFLFAEHNSKSTVLRDELGKMEDPNGCELKFLFANTPKPPPVKPINYLLNYSAMFDLEKAKSQA